MKTVKNGPLIHCITNPISMMQCANTILGLGARPIMAEHPKEVKEITATAKALLLNLGNISDSRMQAMEIAFEEALARDIPVVFDAVGVSCSGLRREFKGNYSEIMALYDESYRSEGVDAREGTGKEEIAQAAKRLSECYKAVILASGAVDVITDGTETAYVEIGCLELSMITGTGCMLGAVCGALLAEKQDMDSVTKACMILGIAGEMAAEGDEVGAGTFLIRLLDNISLMTDEILEVRKRLEIRR